MNTQPMIRISPTDLDTLMGTLEVTVVAISECCIGRGYRVDMKSVVDAGLHYNLKGTGRMFVGNQAPIELKPHTLIIVPPNSTLRIETAPAPGTTTVFRPVGIDEDLSATNGVKRFMAGDAEPEIVLICVFFNATYGPAADLFTVLGAPIVEQFDQSRRIEVTLKTAQAEFENQEIGAGAMSSALLKEAIVTVLRRSLTSIGLWVEGFALLSDPQIARAFAEMAAHPGADHTVISLAQNAALSRSAFMSRFTDLVGESPMTILRDLRMRQAARQLKSTHMPVDQIARSCGYDNRSSFVRAFRKSFGHDPIQHRLESAPSALLPTALMAS